MDSVANWAGSVINGSVVCGSDICVVVLCVYMCVLLCSGKVNLPDELDEIEVYGSEAQSGTQLATYSFEVRSYLIRSQ